MKNEPNHWWLLSIFVVCALLSAIVTTVAKGQGMCGYPPYPPHGCFYVCICEEGGFDCRQVLICEGED